jgi:hypothetical protein
MTARHLCEWRVKAVQMPAAVATIAQQHLMGFVFAAAHAARLMLQWARQACVDGGIDVGEMAWGAAGRVAYDDTATSPNQLQHA